MATASGQQPANLANTPTQTAARNSSTSAPPPSESPAPGLTTTSSPSQAANATNGGTNGFLASSAAQNDGPMQTDLRLYPRDGRVRNPVPSKLKDVTEQMKGNFGVMHMDVASHRASEGRDAAAKRTSESTALQAKMAQTDTYVSHQRRANYPRPPGLKQFSSPTKSVEPSVEPPGPSAAPLSGVDTKAEQARLLTLLRTLPPQNVVDQLCKAIAFFGGVPEAPPPADGRFPESAEENGPGSLFVGWIAEIFPNLDRPRRQTPPPPVQTTTGQRRPRGRPKGSKASKARSDKGLKKGSKKSTNPTQDPQDDAWVDVEESVLTLNGDEDLVEDGDTSRNAPSTPPRVPDSEQFNNTPATVSTGGFRSINDGSAAPLSSTKRRGRPKGSKNRPKELSSSQQGSQPAELAAANLNPPSQPAVVPTLQAPPKVTPVPVPVPMLGDQSKKKINTGRPKGSKNRQKNINEGAVQNGPTAQPQAPALANNQNNQPPSQTPKVATLSTNSTATSHNNAAALRKDKRTQLPAPFATPSSQIPTPQVKESTIVGKKRKRPSANTNVAHPQVDRSTEGIVGSSSLSQQTQPAISQTTVTPTQTHQQQTSVSQPNQQSSLNIATPPAAKRSRKSQESNSMQAAKRSTPNIATKSSVSSTAVASDSAHPSSQATIPPQNAMPAEGLTAHYERMAALQSRPDQTQNYTNRPQKQQQQQQATASIMNTVSPAPAEGLEAHYERFTALQTRQDGARQSTVNRQQMHQHTTQNTSPIPSQTPNAPQMPSSLTSHQPTRTSQNYYPQPQTLSSSYNAQPSSYPTTQRQPQHMATSSPGTGLVQHVTNSPQFGAQSNSPLIQGDNNYRGSPSLLHNSTGYAQRQTASGSPLDNNYRAASTTGHSVSNHSPHFGARQTPTTTHSTSHPAMSSPFHPFPDSSFLDIQSLNSGSNHSGLDLGASSYGLGSGGVPPQQQRTTGSSAASLYSSATGMNSSYLPSSSVGRTSQNRWPS
ncbi:hypothetical protein F4779DRAFT_622850 [Xylariaceae sp. FL0662B]|nr:hypothetical protein F4779DRAFT_622850 [Xylariaceae sp. FL0662B]